MISVRRWGYASDASAPIPADHRWTEDEFYCPVCGDIQPGAHLLAARTFVRILIVLCIIGMALGLMMAGEIIVVSAFFGVLFVACDFFIQIQVYGAGSIISKSAKSKKRDALEDRMDDMETHLNAIVDGLKDCE